MNVFRENSYKRALSNCLLHRKKVRPSYTYEAMAKACGVQKTYLSKVLKHNGNLNLDQLYAACEFLKFKEVETEFVFALYHSETSMHPIRRSQYQLKIEELRKKALTTESKLAIPESAPSGSILAEYYADPHYSLIHMFLTIERFRKEVRLISSFLALSEKRLSHYLDRLEEMQLIQQVGDGWRVVKDTLHLPESSVFVKAHRVLMRLKAIEKTASLSEDEFYSFTVAYSSDENVQKEIRERFLLFIEDVQKLVEKGKTRDVYQLNFDLLKWS